jgi:hypothetical protein
MQKRLGTGNELPDNRSRGFAKKGQMIAKVFVSILVTLSILGCAEDPTVAAFERMKAQIDAMPDGPQKAALYGQLADDVHREREIEAVESIAQSQERLAQPTPTPYVNPYSSPVQVQIVPYH